MLPGSVAITDGIPVRYWTYVYRLVPTSWSNYIISTFIRHILKHDI